TERLRGAGEPTCAQVVRGRVRGRGLVPVVAELQRDEDPAVAGGIVPGEVDAATRFLAHGVLRQQVTEPGRVEARRPQRVVEVAELVDRGELRVAGDVHPGREHRDHEQVRIR